MRVVLGLLLLLLCGSGAQGEDGCLGEESTEQTTEQTTPDIWAEVRALRDMVVGLNVHVELLQRENSDLQTRVSSTERELLVSKSRIDQLETKNAAQATDLKSLETRLTATERKTSDLEKENADLQTRVSSTESELLIIKSRIAQLERENAERPKVAFYAAVTNVGHVGPHDTDVALTHSKIFTNIGNAYNPATGYFTAPVKGVYYLQFTVCSEKAGHMGLIMHKNNQSIMFNARWYKAVGLQYITNSVVLELIAGDKINLVLPSTVSLYDDINNHSTFTGALLFPL